MKRVLIVGVMVLGLSFSAFAKDSKSLLIACKKDCPLAKTEKDVHNCVESKSLSPKSVCSIEAKKHASHKHEEGHSDKDGHSH